MESKSQLPKQSVSPLVFQNKQVIPTRHNREWFFQKKLLVCSVTLLLGKEPTDTAAKELYLNQHCLATQATLSI